ncbi:fructosamine kinase family protein [Virgibacillus sediminis]|uniref:Fructosamine kinase family protein n=1 Tax=Virgibacillus sediminis TaxID=202260 RepID=A0ABV7A3J4_9BACI
MDNSIVEKALYQAGDQSRLVSTVQIHGGSINKSFYVETEKNQYFIKYHPDPPENFFHTEAHGLESIRRTDSVQVPEVFTYSDTPGEAFLVMEWIEGKAFQETDALLGEGIAKMHRAHAGKHGFSEDTYIGLLPQKNGLYERWIDYYRESRLTAQWKLGIQKGRIDGKRRERMETLLAGLDKWIPSGIKASCLHGDLWGGNWIIGSDGVPFVIDPSVLYGDRHFDLAFTEVFGGFSSQFYEAYNECYPIEDYYQEVKPLYQLYYLLVHLNLFGESYGSSVDAVLRRYTGK